jgi:hypothetical protein
LSQKAGLDDVPGGSAGPTDGHRPGATEFQGHERSSTEKKALAAAVLGLAATGAGYFLVERSQFFQSYLIAFLYVLGFAGGSLGC